MRRPNVVVAFADQWRADATGYAGDPNVKTPNLDALAGRSVNFTHAIAGCPVCSPYRASLLTGQYPLTHGVFVNDVCLNPDAVSLAKVFAAAGYDTAYVGKWHLDGHGRSNYIPRDRRQGFEYFKALECTHNYNHSAYYDGDCQEKRLWEGYDAIAQTRDAARYIRSHDRDRPLLLVLSWGPPHAPYHTAPQAYRAMYDPAALRLRPNVAAEAPQPAPGSPFKHYRDWSPREWLAGYYAHCSALDACVGELLDALRGCGMEEETIFLFTSDHGDMLGSQGQIKKQRPWDESIRVPFLLHWPGLGDRQARQTPALIDAPDVMPTLLRLAGIEVPATVEGKDFSAHLRGGDDPSAGEGLIACYHPFGQFTRAFDGGREWRGLRTVRYTYVSGRGGPWLLYDNEADPYQLENVVDRQDYRAVRDDLDARLRRRLEAMGDEFLLGTEYMGRWGYPYDEKTETVRYTN